ncbi:MAG: hypothetical protein AAB468_00400 [Patescibacteria group bacterium]
MIDIGHAEANHLRQTQITAGIIVAVIVSTKNKAGEITERFVCRNQNEYHDALQKTPDDPTEFSSIISSGDREAEVPIAFVGGHFGDRIVLDGMNRWRCDRITWRGLDVAGFFDGKIDVLG